jgi:hypothetical protein
LAALVVLAQEMEQVSAAFEAALVELVQEMVKQRELAPSIQLVLEMTLELKQLKVLETPAA